MIKLLIFFILLNSSGAISSIKSTIKKESVKIGIDPAIALAIVENESNFKTSATNYEKTYKTHSAGLFQVMLPTARYLGFKGSFKQLMVPKTNIYYGLKYLKKCINKYGNNINKIGCCYNAGYNATDRCNLPGVKRYSKNLKINYKKWKRNLNSSPGSIQ